MGKYLVDKIIAYLKDSKVKNPLKLLAISNHLTTKARTPKIEIGDFVTIDYSESKCLYVLSTPYEFMEITETELIRDREIFQKTYRIDDEEQLYVKVSHMHIDDQYEYTNGIKDATYVMLFVNSESEYGRYTGIFRLASTESVKDFSEKVVTSMIKRNTDADEEDIRYLDLPFLLDVNVDIAEHMMPF